MRKVGYVYGFCDKGYIEEQFDALEELSLDTICYEKEGTQKITQNDEILEEVVAVLKPGDEIVIYELRCLGKAIIQLGDFLKKLQEKGIVLVVINKGRSLQELSDEMLTNLIISISFSEKEIISDRTTRGLELARRKGRVGGRPKISKETINKIHELYHKQSLTLREISEQCDISIGTAYKYAQLE